MTSKNKEAYIKFNSHPPVMVCPVCNQQQELDLDLPISMAELAAELKYFQTIHEACNGITANSFQPLGIPYTPNGCRIAKNYLDFYRIPYHGLTGWGIVYAANEKIKDLGAI